MLKITPVSFKEAADFVNDKHRHHKTPQGHKFSIGLEQDGKLIGVCIVGRPVSRHYDDGLTLEVTRLCTEGVKNACSMLYGAAWRAARALGYERMVTYTLASEQGSSLKAAGFKYDGIAGGLHWTGTRNRGQQIPAEMKKRWIKGNW